MCVCKQRALNLAALATAEGSIEDAATDAATTALHNRTEDLAKTGNRQARLIHGAKKLHAHAGVKVRILVSTAQIIGELGTAYGIRYPSVYEDSVEKIDNVNLDFQFLPFGCLFPSFDNYVFFFVLRTLVPLSEGLRFQIGAPSLHSPGARNARSRVSCLVGRSDGAGADAAKQGVAGTPRQAAQDD
eukprot:2585026-Prymnesium_polylepis.2